MRRRPVCALSLGLQLAGPSWPLAGRPSHVNVRLCLEHNGAQWMQLRPLGSAHLRRPNSSGERSPGRQALTTSSANNDAVLFLNSIDIIKQSIKQVLAARSPSSLSLKPRAACPSVRPAVHPCGGQQSSGPKWLSLASAARLARETLELGGPSLVGVVDSGVGRAFGT